MNSVLNILYTVETRKISRILQIVENFLLFYLDMSFNFLNTHTHTHTHTQRSRAYLILFLLNQISPQLFFIKSCGFFSPLSCGEGSGERS